MFKVQANSPEEYFDADPARKSDLLALDALIRKTAPGLERWFYGRFQYEVKSGQQVEWPIVGLALQKNYISLYTSVVKDGAPITDGYKGALGELKIGALQYGTYRIVSSVAGQPASPSRASRGTKAS
jgi:hypothetical protein